MALDYEHWRIDAKVYDDRVEETHIVSDPTRNIRKKPYTAVWHIDRYLGRGSCGEVRLERNKKEDKVRAVKILATSSSALNQKECEQELKALLEFSKPKSKDAAVFVEFFGWFSSDFSMYLAMEYIELGDLEHNVPGKLPEVEVQSIAEQILLGLEIMHTASFAHRDLKPQNILVVVGPPQWWVKLADFGLSKRLTENTAYRTSAGTLLYMAPELRDYLGQATSGEYTNAVDLWAVGCITYRLLTGIVPFPRGKSLYYYCENKSIFPNEPLIECSVTDSGSKFVQQLLVKDPKERLSAAKALQHHWITSCDFAMTISSGANTMAISPSANAAAIPPSASQSPVERAGPSGPILSVIEYNTASHAGLKTYSSEISPKTSALPALNPTLSLASPFTSKTADARYSIPKKSLQQNLPLASKRNIEKDLRASSNETTTRYEPESTIKTSRNSDPELATVGNMPIELTSKQGQDLFNDCKYSEAEQAFQQLIEIQEKVLGKEVPKVLQSKSWLASVFHKQQQYQKAGEVYREVVQGQEKIHGKEAPETLESKNRLASTLYKQEKYQEAEKVFREVVQGREKAHGKEALETLGSKDWLASALHWQEKYQEAGEMFREVVQGREKILGKEAPETLGSKHCLASALFRQEQYQEAEEVFREVVQGREKVHGNEASETLRSKDWLVKTISKQERNRLRTRKYQRWMAEVLA